MVNKKEEKKMKIKILAAALMAVSSATAMAGTMGPPEPTKQLIFEGGFNYLHTFYKDQVIPPESRTANYPNGFPFKPSNFYPENFYGGYIGLSMYLSGWLLNSRLNMFGNESKRNLFADTLISMAPGRLAFTVDKVFGDINNTSFGLGAGAVVATLNKGAYIEGANAEPGTQGSSTLDGQGSRVDPVIEAFAMKRVSNNVALKFNAEYQINVNSSNTNGGLVLALGANYAVDV
jgi:hypothetical protein